MNNEIKGKEKENEENPLSPYKTGYDAFDKEVFKQYGMDWGEINPNSFSTKQEKDLYNTYADALRQYETMGENYKTSTSDLKKSYSLNLQNAYINSRLAEKYLPIYLKKAGIENLGVAQSSVSELGTNYANLIAGINNSQAQEQAKLKEKYDKSMLDVQALLQSDVATGKEKNSQDAIAHLNYAFNDLIKNPNKQLTETEIDTLTNEYNKYKDLITDSLVRQEFDDLYNKAQVRGTSAVRDDIALVGKTNAIDDNAGDNFQVEYNGAKYKVEKGYDVPADKNAALSEFFKNQTGGNPYEGAIMIEDGKIYIYANNNNENRKSWATVQGRGKDQKPFNDLCKAIGINPYERREYDFWEKLSTEDLLDEKSELEYILTLPGYTEKSRKERSRKIKEIEEELARRQQKNKEK